MSGGTTPMRNNRHRITFAQSLTGKMEEQTAAAERNVRNPLCYSGEELAARGLGLEWLETDGLGGFACGTAVGVRTRKYHGWYIPAVPPPRKRWMVVAGCEELVLCDGRTTGTGDSTIPSRSSAATTRTRTSGIRSSGAGTWNPAPKPI